MYSQAKYYAVLHYDLKVINSKSPYLSGQIYYHSNKNFNTGKVRSFILNNSDFNKTYHFNIPIDTINTKFIRFDPLNYAATVEISNIYISNSNTNIFIDLTKLDMVHKQQNIKLISNKDNKLYLKLTGNDPGFMLIDNQIITSNYPPIIFYIKVLFASLIITLFLLLIYYKLIKTQITSLEAILASLIITIYSIYSITLSNGLMVTNLIYIFFTLSLFAIIKQDTIQFIKSYKYFVLFLISLLVITFASDISNNATRIKSLYNKMPHILMISTIAFAFIQSKNFKHIYFKYFLTILTFAYAIFTILLQLDIIEIDRIYLYGYKLSQTAWTQKNYIFWFIFLMWGTISFYRPLKNKKDLFVVLLLLIISSISIFTNYSSSIKVAFILSSSLYLLLLVFKLKDRFIKIFPAIIIGLLIFSPIIMKLFIIIGNHYPTYFHSRGTILTIATKMIYLKPIFGYGFYSTNSLPLQEHLPYELIKNYLSYYNPHSIPLWLWLNFGIVGVLIISIFIYLALKHTLQKTVSYEQKIALISLVVSFLFITYFSWSGWWNIVFLTYAFFASIILLSLNQNKN
jgi:hypothetical protein